MNKLTFTINETCRETCLSRTSIYKLIANDQIRARKIGKKTVILAADLQEFLNSLPLLPSNSEKD